MTKHKLSPVYRMTGKDFEVTTDPDLAHLASEEIVLEDVERTMPQPYTGKSFVFMKDGTEYLTSWAGGAEVAIAIRDLEKNVPAKKAWVEKMVEWVRGL